MRCTNLRWSGFLFLGLLLCARGELALSNAYASYGPSWDDPQTLDVSDIKGIVGQAFTYEDPTAEALVVAVTPPPVWGAVPGVAPARVPSRQYAAAITRGPPSVD
jgi:hypothetical protein